jgi:hypothetical protein
VSPDVRYQMQQSLNEIGNKKWKLNEADEETNSDEDPTSQNLNIEVEEILNLFAPSNSSNKWLEVVTKTVKFESDYYFIVRPQN